MAISNRFSGVKADERNGDDVQRLILVLTINNDLNLLVYSKTEFFRRKVTQT